MRQYLLKRRLPRKKKEKEERKKHPQNKDQACKCQKLLRFWTRRMMQECIRRTQTLRVSQGHRDPKYPTQRSCGSTKSQWYALNAQCVPYKGIVVQERFRNSSRKIEEDRKNDAHKIHKGLNGGKDFKHHEAYKILAREPRWANLRDDRLNHAVNVPRNVARRTSDNSSPGNSIGSNNLSKDPDGSPTPQSVGPNSDLDGSLYEGGSRPIGQKIYRKNIGSQKAMEGVTTSGSGVHALLDELRLEKIQAKEEKEKKRVEVMQHWQAKIDLEQAKEDHKIMEKDLSTLSGN
ncbi:hypothetical protein GIB67_001276 [Kingdonia uniflora]|uniref:No apical meristem-associated C-terminal domain-containing protein n=1 Tax=Kingdonia uniflora TaxID=39325 RepID=A0A7J7LLA5_9MAGN|nr:hypothetical protein GIB67_001276 [Kingdonia uniflora]